MLQAELASAQEQIARLTTGSDRAGRDYTRVREHLGILMAEGDKLSRSACRISQLPISQECLHKKTAWEANVGSYLRANLDSSYYQRWKHELTNWMPYSPAQEITYEVGILSKMIAELK